MPYTTEALNKKADATHERIYPGQIAALHALGRANVLDAEHYDTPDSLRRCACALCNAARRLHGARPRTWQGIARTKH